MTVLADDVDVLQSCLAWLKAKKQVALATVIKTWGSSPRPPGCLMAMNSEGHFVGSLSGGCVEQMLTERFCNGELSVSLPTIIDFGVDSQEASRIGLPCGGRLEVVVEVLTEVKQIVDLLERLQQGELVSRRISLADGSVILEQGQAGAELQISGRDIIKTFGPAWQIMIIGDGQLARHLASMAMQLDYRVTICDPRDLFTQENPVKGVCYIREMPDDAVRGLTNQERLAVVTLAHDPRQDDLALTAALESKAFYIGALGSVRSAQTRWQRLESLGYSHQQLGRIYGPAGLSIGSKRPAEIAVSILAQITAIRNGITQAQALTGI